MENIKKDSIYLKKLMDLKDEFIKVKGKQYYSETIPLYDEFMRLIYRFPKYIVNNEFDDNLIKQDKILLRDLEKLENSMKDLKEKYK